MIPSSRPVSTVWHRIVVAAIVAAVFVVGAVPAPAIGQSDGLPEVERLAEQGRFTEARDTLASWFEAGWNTAPRGDRQLAVWLRGLLSLDPDAAELDYRRLVVEYPGGSYSDQALLRLAQGTQARGDEASAGQYLETLVRDYPESPLRVEARSLLARLEGGAGGGAVATAAPPPGPAPSDRLTIQGPGATGPDELSGTDPFTIQLGAFSTEGRALSQILEARAEGLDPRLVQVAGSELLRVRLGQFATPEEAEAEAELLREMGFQAVVSSDRALEEEIR